jgi:hypothetical protein
MLASRRMRYTCLANSFFRARRAGSLESLYTTRVFASHFPRQVGFGSPSSISILFIEF